MRWGRDEVGGVRLCKGRTPMFLQHRLDERTLGVQGVVAFMFSLSWESPSRVWPNDRVLATSALHKCILSCRRFLIRITLLRQFSTVGDENKSIAFVYSKLGMHVKVWWLQVTQETNKWMTSQEFMVRITMYSSHSATLSSDNRRRNH